MKARRETHLRWAVAATAMAGVAISGCGSGADYRNEPRPPVPITVTAAIAGDHVEVSPTRFGAGPITLIVTNQTDRSQELTFETDELGASQSGFRQATGPINPQGTARLQASVRAGTYQVRVHGAGIRPARITVGASRPSAQNQLLQP